MNLEMKTSLLKHQHTAFDKLKKLTVGALFADTGTGKTRTALELIRYRLEKNKIKNVLWITPVSTKQNLVDEINKHSAFSVSYIEQNQDTLIKIVGHESISQSDFIYIDCINWLKEHPGSQLIIDESHFIKNPGSVRYDREFKISEAIKYKLIMTGTPITLGVWDLFTQFQVLSPKILGYRSYSAFAKAHLQMSEKYPGRVAGLLNEEYIDKSIAPYTFQITKKECLDLPEKTYSARYFYPKSDDIFFKTYELIKKIMLDLIADQEEWTFEFSITIFKLYGYLHRLSSGYIDTVINGIDVCYKSYDRVNLLLQTINEIDLDKNKVIVFYRYNSDLEMICDKLSLPFAVFNGNLSESQKSQNLLAFKNEKNILLANIQSGSTGLNLQHANYIIYYNGTFDLGKRLQSEDRIYRLGQKKNCHIIDLVANNTIDQRILTNIKNKVSTLQWLRDQLKRISSADNKSKLLDKLERD